jgi:hypothetical protein
VENGSQNKDPFYRKPIQAGPPAGRQLVAGVSLSAVLGLTDGRDDLDLSGIGVERIFARQQRVFPDVAAAIQDKFAMAILLAGDVGGRCLLDDLAIDGNVLLRHGVDCQLRDSYSALRASSQSLVCLVWHLGQERFLQE